MKNINIISGILVFCIILPVFVKGQFEASVVREGVFTVGEPSIFIVYVENIGALSDNYTITYDVDYNYPTAFDDLSHLIEVNLNSNRIENLRPGEIRETQGTIIFMGQVFHPPGATITFTIDSDRGFSDTKQQIVSGSFSQSLPELSLIGMVGLLVLVLIIFYSFHLS
jgi:hypothetical protein